MKNCRAFLKRWLRRDSGSATVEFVILFPVIIILFGSSIEAGMLTSRQAMLERSVDIVVRQLRLGQITPMTHAEVKRRICAQAGVISDCNNALNIELLPVKMDTWGFPNTTVKCVDRVEQISPAIEFKPGVENELMLMRVCAAVRPMMPTSGLGLRLPRISGSGVDGDYAMYVTTSFVNEPQS